MQEVNMENENITDTMEQAPAAEADVQAPAQEQPQPAREQRPQIVVTQEMLDKSKKTLATMLDYLGLEGTVKAEGRTSKINLLVSSEDAGRIIGRKGQSLESLQTLLNRMMQKENIDFPKVYIDIDGYSSKRGERREDRRDDRRAGDRRDRGPRGRRDGGRSYHDDDDGNENDENLRQQAIDASKEVRRWGEPVTLPPMNAHDRRIIHITLEGESDLQTESTGEGNFKSVVISLKK